MPETDYTKPTATLVSLTVARLKELLPSEDVGAPLPWHAAPFYGTSHEQLFAYLPSLMTEAAGMSPVQGMPFPVAVVMYGGSGHAYNPRRTATIEVLLIAETPNEAAGAAIVAPLLDRAIALLDEHIDGSAKWEIRRDEPLDIGPDHSCIRAEFEIRDT